MYLGEITRNILLHLIDQPPVPGTKPHQYYLFKGHSTPALNGHYGVDTSFMSEVETAQNPDAIRKIIVTHLEIDPSFVSDADTEVSAILYCLSPKLF